jgi:hypothetical protein
MMTTFGVVREENKKSTRKKMPKIRLIFVHNLSPLFWHQPFHYLIRYGAPCHSLLPISMFLSSFSNKLMKSEWNSLQLIIFKVKHTKIRLTLSIICHRYFDTNHFITWFGYFLVCFGDNQLIPVCPVFRINWWSQNEIHCSW